MCAQLLTGNGAAKAPWPVLPRALREVSEPGFAVVPNTVDERRGRFIEQGEGTLRAPLRRQWVTEPMSKSFCMACPDGPHVDALAASSGLHPTRLPVPLRVLARRLPTRRSAINRSPA